MERRDFLSRVGALAAGTLAGCGGEPRLAIPPGSLAGPDRTLGHRLRRGDFPPPNETRRTAILIVGAGIGGLSAAWRCARAGFGDTLLVEMEREAGGNSRYGENAVSRYPLGAHYLPLPPPEAVAVRELLADLGAIDGDPHALRPRYAEHLVCAAPQERLYKDGLWQEGLLPKLGVGAAELGQQQRFHELIDAFKRARDHRGRRAFSLPMQHSSRDDEWLSLDRLDFASWLRQNGLDAPSLHWLADYACRDDFGTTAAATSAWAGLHYFASRVGEAENAVAEAVLTAPEGNGWLVRGLRERVADRLLTGAIVYRVGETSSGIEADLYLPAANRSLRVVAQRLLWAAPVFQLPRVVERLPETIATACRSFDYTPWLVANLTLRHWPVDAGGAPPAWDNVYHAGPGLGVVVATHQQLRYTDGPTVWTYYRPLVEATPARWRAALETIPREAWAAAIIDELSVPHADLATLVERVDVTLWGHAMVRPVPGLIWGEARQRLAAGFGRIHIAHADASGMSIFEEANYRGVVAAEAALAALGQRVAPLAG